MRRAEASTARRVALGLIGLAISALAVWLLLRNIDLAATASVLGSARPGPLLLAAVVLASQASLRAIRWRTLLGSAVGRSLPIVPVYMAMLAGYLGNAVLPARLGEAVRAGMLGRSLRLPVPTVLGTAVLERLVDILMLAVIGAAVVLVLAVPAWVAAVVGVGLLGAVTGLLILVALAQRPGWFARISVPAPAVVLRVAKELRAGLRVVERPQVLGAAGALTFAAWCLDATIFWLVAQSLGLELTAAEAVLVSVVGVLSTAVPSAPGYVGTFELGVVAAAGLAGVTGSAALAFAVLAHVMTLLPLALAGAISLVVMQAGGRASEPAGFTGTVA